MPVNTVERSLIDLIRAAFPFEERSARLPDFSQLDWQLLVETASHHGLAPLTFAALKQCALLQIAPASAVETLRLARVRAGVVNRLAFQELAAWLERLQRDDIPVIILKGAALAPTLYRDPGLRPLGDLDLLFPRSTIARVEAALIEQGYVPEMEPTDGFAHRFMRERCFRRQGNKPAQVDVHWHVFTTDYYAERAPIDWFWQRTIEIQINRQRALILSPTAQLLHLSAHYALHGFQRLIWLYDLALLIARSNERIDWDDAFDAAARCGLLPPVSEALAAAGEKWGVRTHPLAEDHLRAMRLPRKDLVMFGVARLLADNQIWLQPGLTGSGVRKKLTYLRHVFFPTRAWMRMRYVIRHSSLLPLYYVWRAGTGACRIVQATHLIIRAALRLWRPHGALQ